MSTTRTTQESLPAAASLRTLGQEFGKLQIQIEILKEINAVIGKNTALQKDLTYLIQDFGETKLRRMNDICWQAASLQANTNSELALKSQMLREFCVTNDHDIVHDLANSICRDIQSLLSNKTDQADQHHQAGNPSAPPRCAKRRQETIPLCEKSPGL